MTRSWRRGPRPRRRGDAFRSDRRCAAGSGAAGSPPCRGPAGHRAGQWLGSACGRRRGVAGRSERGRPLMPPAPYVAVVILHWGAAETTARCVRSLADASWPGRGTVFIIDNTKRLDERAVTGAAPLEVEIVRPERNLGFCDGSTLGMSMAMKRGADFVLLLNNDVVWSTTSRHRERGQPGAEAGLCPPRSGMGQPRRRVTGRHLILWSGFRPGHGRRRCRR